MQSNSSSHLPLLIPAALAEPGLCQTRGHEPASMLVSPQSRLTAIASMDLASVTSHSACIGKGGPRDVRYREDD